MLTTLRNWYYRTRSNSLNVREHGVPAMLGHSRSDYGPNLESIGLNMKLINAVGGKIIEFSRYDERTDRSSKSIYVIADEKDFTLELSRIIDMEAFRG